jgi:transposase
LVQTEAVVWLTTPEIGVITAADVDGAWRTLTPATSPQKLVTYGGRDPTIRGSGKRPDHYGAISYPGSRWFRAALCQAGSRVIEPAHQNADLLARADRCRERGLTRRPIDGVAAHKLVRMWWARLAHHQVFAPPTWNGPALAADWRPKVHTVAHRRTAEATWSQFMTTRAP